MSDPGTDSVSPAQGREGRRWPPSAPAQGAPRIPRSCLYPTHTPLLISGALGESTATCPLHLLVLSGKGQSH